MHLQRPHLLLAAPACLLLAAAWRGAPATPGQEEVFFEPYRVTDTLFMLDSGVGGNVGVCLGEDGLFVIDDQFERTAPALREALERLSDDGVELLLNTHFHGDHSGGNPAFDAGATILAHENVRKRLLAGDADRNALPELTYSEGVTLHVNGQTIRAEHYPASHTDGDTAVFFEEANAVHMGDLFFSGRFPYIDQASGGSVDGLIRSVETILGKIDAETKLIPGHGPLSTQPDLVAYRDMLVACRAKVAEARAAGQSAAQMKSSKLLADYDDWAWGFIDAERFIDILVAGAGG